MPLDVVLLLGFLIFAAALLYSSVGHAGASGYLAVMGLFGLAPEVMKPTALLLNVLVASVATVQFYRAGCFSASLFWPFAVSSVPFALLGGALTLPGRLYNPAVGLLLLLAAHQLWKPPRSHGAQAAAPAVRISTALASGAGIGLLSGLTGTGGGIFLSPLLLFMGWAEARDASGVSAAFNLVNSVAGLVGVLAGLSKLPGAVPLWATAAVAGGILGSSLGSRKLGSAGLRRLLAIVLVVAGTTLILAAWS